MTKHHISGDKIKNYFQDTIVFLWLYYIKPLGQHQKNRGFYKVDEMKLLDYNMPLDKSTYDPIKLMEIQNYILFYLFNLKFINFLLRWKHSSWNVILLCIRKLNITILQFLPWSLMEIILFKFYSIMTFQFSITSFITSLEKLLRLNLEYHFKMKNM